MRFIGRSCSVSALEGHRLRVPAYRSFPSVRIHAPFFCQRHSTVIASAARQSMSAARYGGLPTCVRERNTAVLGRPASPRSSQNPSSAISPASRMTEQISGYGHTLITGPICRFRGTPSLVVVLVRCFECIPIRRIWLHCKRRGRHRVKPHGNLTRAGVQVGDRFCDRPIQRCAAHLRWARRMPADGCSYEGSPLPGAALVCRTACRDRRIGIGFQR